MAALSISNTTFALELLRTLSQANPSGNIFVSPLSISSALAMVYLGAKGDTATQMAKVNNIENIFFFLHLCVCLHARVFTWFNVVINEALQQSSFQSSTF